MADKKMKRTVVHPRYYQKVEGKLVHVAPGTVVEVTKAQAESAGSKLAKKGDAKTLKGGQLVNSPDSGENAQIAELTAQVTAAQEAQKAAEEKAKADAAKAQTAMVAMQSQLTDAQKAQKAAEAKLAKLEKAAK